MGFRGQSQRQVISPMVDIPLVPKEQKEGVALVVSDLVDQSSFPIPQLEAIHRKNNFVWMRQEIALLLSLLILLLPFFYFCYYEEIRCVPIPFSDSRVGVQGRGFRLREFENMLSGFPPGRECASVCGPRTR